MSIHSTDSQDTLGAADIAFEGIVHKPQNVVKIRLQEGDKVRVKSGVFQQCKGQVLGFAPFGLVWVQVGTHALQILEADLVLLEPLE